MRTRTRTLLTATALLSLAVPLAACGAEDDAPDTEPVTGATEDPGSAQTDDTAPTDDGAATGTSGSDPDSAVFAAIDLAESEAGGTAFELDREDDDDREGWEISVAVDGADVDVLVNHDGTEVLGTDPDDDLSDAERAALDSATVTLADAVQTAIGEVDGRLDDVELDEERGTVAWEVSVEDDIEVYVDITTGEILEIDRG